MVASCPQKAGGVSEKNVSIPFIAGQWSLRAQNPERRQRIESFNPLHCGAVVASPKETRKGPCGCRVSIPFIAGQWSLQAAARSRSSSATGAFQSPSLRGSGRFRKSWRGRKRPLGFQSPSLRGSGRFKPARGRRRSAELRFNPLHCGAVVASGREPERALVTGTSFNPLHCGAVVASADLSRAELLGRIVSIPFIAGQWSLRPWHETGPKKPSSFQSPSLRGSGRFGRADRPPGMGHVMSQSPSLRGSGRFLLPVAPTMRRARMSQSPSLRGSGRFLRQRVVGC